MKHLEWQLLRFMAEPYMTKPLAYPCFLDRSGNFFGPLSAQPIVSEASVPRPALFFGVKRGRRFFRATEAGRALAATI